MGAIRSVFPFQISETSQAGLFRVWAVIDGDLLHQELNIHGVLV